MGLTSFRGSVRDDEAGPVAVWSRECVAARCGVTERHTTVVVWGGARTIQRQKLTRPSVSVTRALFVR